MKFFIVNTTLLFLIGSIVCSQNQVIQIWQTVRKVTKYQQNRGGHGFALLEGRGPVISWAQRCIEWMKMRGILAGR
jgi:hypothetical protein